MKSEKQKKIRLVFSAALSVLCLCLAAGTVWLSLQISRERRYEKQLSLGDKYLEEMDYENARIAFEQAIEINEKKAVGYVKLAVLYLEAGEYETALETAGKGRENSGEDQRFEKIENAVFRKAPELAEDSKENQEKEEESGQEESEEKIDWEKVFSTTKIGQLSLLETDALNYTVSDGNSLHEQEGIIGAQQVKLGEKLYLACIYLSPGESADGVRKNQLHVALYEGKEEFSLVGESTLEMTSGFSGSYIRSQRLGIYYREKEDEAQWIFAMDTLLWESEVREAAILSFDGSSLREQWNSLAYLEGGNQEVLTLDGEEIIFSSGVEDNGSTPEDVQEEFQNRLQEENLSQAIFTGDAEGDLELVCWLENKTENLSFSGAAVYEGAWEDHTQIREKMPKTEAFSIPQEQWDMLSDVTGVTLWYLEQYERLSEEAAFSMDALSNNDVGYMMMIYLDTGDENQKDVFPALRTENAETIYSQETVNYFFRSLVGKEPEGILTAAQQIQGEEINYLHYENGEYGIPMADGAPVYRTRYLQGVRQGDQVTVLTELIQEANVSTTSMGIYQIRYAADENSAFGYHVVSVERAPQVDGAFTRVEASSELQEAGQDHRATMMRDKNLSTAWVEGVAGTGEGETITLYAESPQKVHGIRIAAGFYKDRDLFEKNGRPTRLRFTFSDGTELEANLTETLYHTNRYQGVVGSYGENGVGVSMDWSNGKDWLDFVSFGQEIETQWIEITIVSAVAGTKYEDTCISELVVY